MGSKVSDLPFPRGQTYYTTPDATSHDDICGKIYCIEDINFAQAGQVTTLRTGRYVYLMAVRNVTGSAMLPKLLARFKVDGAGNQFLYEVNGYADTVGQIGYPIDEYLPAAGVADDDIFYIVIGGPATVTTAAAGDTNISIGSMVVPSTGGKVVDQATSEDDADIFPQIQGAIGRAVVAVNAINTDFLIDVQRRM